MSVASSTEPPNKTTMNNTKTNIIGAIAVIALLGVLLLAAKPTSAPTTQLGGTVTTAVVPAAGSALTDGTILPNPSTFDYLVSRTYLSAQNAFGLGNSTSVPTNFEATRASLTSGTSTPCALLNPLNATSTITNFVMNITTATSSAIIWAVGTSTTAYATTTSMESVSVGAGKQSTISWDGGINNTVIGPGQYVVVGSDSGTTPATGAFATGIVIGGSCQAVFQTAI